MYNRLLLNNSLQTLKQTTTKNLSLSTLFILSIHKQKTKQSLQSKMLLHILLPLIAFSVAEAATFGSVDIDGIGEVFVVAPDWAGPYLEVFFYLFYFFTTK